MISIDCIYLKLLFFFVCFFLWHIGTKDAVPMRLLCFLFFLYRFNIYMQGEKFQQRLVCKVHIPCFAEDRGLI